MKDAGVYELHEMLNIHEYIKITGFHAQVCECGVLRVTERWVWPREKTLRITKKFDKALKRANNAAWRNLRSVYKVKKV